LEAFHGASFINLGFHRFMCL